MITKQEFLYNYQVHVEYYNTEFGIYVQCFSAIFMGVLSVHVFQVKPASYSIAYSTVPQSPQCTPLFVLQGGFASQIMFAITYEYVEITSLKPSFGQYHECS